MGDWWLKNYLRNGWDDFLQSLFLFSRKILKNQVSSSTRYLVDIKGLSQHQLWNVWILRILNVSRSTKSYLACCKWKLWLLHNSKSKHFLEYCVKCYILIQSWFHDYSLFNLWCLITISPLSHCCSNDYWESEVWMKSNEDRRNLEKKGRGTWYFNFKPRNWIFRFIAFKIRVTFKVLLSDLKY